jgi:hypothetical protein
MAFNKMMVMLPMMFAARKLDGEDPNIVFMLRCAYGTIQTLIVLTALYVYMVASKIATSDVKDEEIYVSPPASPFADPNAKPKYTKTTIGAQALSVAQKLVTSTLTGICMTVGLHMYKGMIIGLAMQTVMGPLNLMENTFAKNILFGGAASSIAEGKKSLKEKRIFGEKYREELSDKDEIVGPDGQVVVLKKEKTGKKTAAGASKTATEKFEDLILDTWDEGDSADVQPVIKALTKSNVNYKTKESEWTLLMIMSAINSPGARDVIKKIKTLNGSATMTDTGGWNALHWSAFHNSMDGAEALMEVYEAMKLGLHLVKDNNGMTPMEVAVKEGNKEIASFIKDKIEAALTSSQSEGIADQEGIRKRK